MEKLEKKLNKVKPKGTLANISYQLLISKLVCDKIKNDFVGIDSLEKLKKNKHIIKYIIKIIDLVLEDKSVFPDRKIVKEINKSDICVNVCKILLNLEGSEKEEQAIDDIEFIVGELYKHRGFFLKMLNGLLKSLRLR